MRRVLERSGLVPSLRGALTSAAVCGHWLLSVSLSVEVQCGEHPSFWPPSCGKGGSLSWPPQAAALDSALGLVPTPSLFELTLQSPPAFRADTASQQLQRRGGVGWGPMPSLALPARLRTSVCLSIDGAVTGVKGVPAHSWDVGEQNCPP